MSFTDRNLLGGTDAEELTHYRAVSPRAVVALIAGMASALAFVHPLLWFIPLLAVVVAIAALRETDQPSVALAGRAAALGGLTLALLFGSAAITKRVADRYLIVGQARQLSERWLEAIQAGDVVWAVEWTQPYLYRQPPGASLEEFYRQDPTAQEILTTFATHEVVRAIQAAGPQAEIQLHRAVGFSQQFYSRRYTLHYQVSQPDGDTFLVELLVARDSDPESYAEPRWQVRSYEMVPAKDS